MKRLFSILIVVVLTVTVWAQSPEKMSYQAVIRNSSDQLITNTQIGMQISILQSSANGTVVYTETQMPTTNTNGLVSIEIGGGAGFDAIDWSAGVYYVKTETDPAGGTNYSITGTSQLLSVPYALHAKAAETITGTITENDPVYSESEAANITVTDITNLSNLSGTNTGDQDGSETKVKVGTNISITGTGTTENPYFIGSTAGFTHYIGELYGGGIVVAVGKKDSIEFGLIASLIDLSNGIYWSNIISTNLGTANSTFDGQANTNAIIAQEGHTDSAAKLCDDYSAGGFSDWYLPAILELNQCNYAAFAVNTVLGATDGIKFQHYWSSTEYNDNNAWGVFIGLNTGSYLKGGAGGGSVRAVRRF